MWPETREDVEFEISQLHRLVDGERSLIDKVVDAETVSAAFAAAAEVVAYTRQPGHARWSIHT